MGKFINAEDLEVIARDYLVGKGELEAFMEEIRGASTSEDVAPVIHAHWISYQRGDPGECSHCGLNWDENMRNNGEDWGEWDPNPPYCPNCGAKMDGEKRKQK